MLPGEAGPSSESCRSKRSPGCEIVAEFDSRELSLALGRANVIHAALAEGSLTDKFLAAARLADLDTSGLLCLDDLDLVIGKEAWETALFHGFNRLRAASCRLPSGE